jgi:hypothetical protein
MTSGWLRAGIVAIAVAGSVSPAGAQIVATVLGEDIPRSALPAGADGRERARRLLELAWPRIARHYIERQGLAATAAELAEIAAYHREFERRDRAQRARKLEELEQRLAAAGLEGEERRRLEAFRAVLVRLARRDAENDALPAPDPAQEAARYAPWVEAWKLDRALYERYGGVVALSPSGSSPHGARAALIAEYERQGLLRLPDARLREEVYALLEAPPSTVVAPHEVDFTPYWRRPIPPSYFPD